MSDCSYSNFQVFFELMSLKVVLILVVKLKMIWDSYSLAGVEDTRVARLGPTGACGEHWALSVGHALVGQNGGQGELDSSVWCIFIIQ